MWTKKRAREVRLLILSCFEEERAIEEMYAMNGFLTASFGTISFNILKHKIPEAVPPFHTYEAK
jgi:hypothetical protein